MMLDKRNRTAIANRLVCYPWWVVLLSGGLAGWLMGLLSWLVAACRVGERRGREATRADPAGLKVAV